MPSLVIHKDAGGDLTRIRAVDADAARRIAALIIELQADEDLLDRLSQHGYGKSRSAKIDVSIWVAEQQDGRNLWRLKAWDLENDGLQYRIIYAYEPRNDRYLVLAVVHRDFDYDKSHPITKRIRDTYDRLQDSSR